MSVRIHRVTWLTRSLLSGRCKHHNKRRVQAVKINSIDLEIGAEKTKGGMNLRASGGGGNNALWPPFWFATDCGKGNMFTGHPYAGQCGAFCCFNEFPNGNANPWPIIDFTYAPHMGDERSIRPTQWHRSLSVQNGFLTVTPTFKNSGLSHDILFLPHL